MKEYDKKLHEMNYVELLDTIRYATYQIEYYKSDVCDVAKSFEHLVRIELLVAEIQDRLFKTVMSK